MAAPTGSGQAILTWHPTYAFFHNPNEWGAFDIDVDRFARLLAGATRAKPKVLSITPKARHVRQLLKEWPGVIALDIETAPEHPDRGFTGKDPTRARVKTIGLGNPLHGVSRWWGDGSSTVEREIRRVLADPKVLKILQNGTWFDIRVLRRYGIEVHNVVDTRDARRALSSTSILKLSYLAAIYDDAHPWKENEEDDEKGLVFTKSRRKLKIYNSYDCSYTARVWQGIEADPDWKTERVQNLYRIQRELAEVAASMHTRGVVLDQAERKRLTAKLHQEYKEKEKKLLKAVGIKGFEAKPNFMRALIYKKHATGKYAKYARFNLPDPADPEMYSDPENPGTISVKQQALVLLLIDPDIPKDLQEIIQLYWDTAEIEKAGSTFVWTHLIDEAMGHDGRVRAGWNSCGTVTGRFSCREPNLMNIPKKYRSMYVADKLYEFVGADFSQLELRVRVPVMGDQALAEDLRTGDVYTANAKTWFDLPKHYTKCKCDEEFPDIEPYTCRKPKEHVHPLARFGCKTIHLQSQYASGTKKVYQTALLEAPDENARKVINWQFTVNTHKAFKKRYWQTVEYWPRAHAEAIKNGYSEDWIHHRRRHYPAADRRTPPITETSNYDTQATAAAVKNECLIKLHKYLQKYVPGAGIEVDIHDAITIEAPKGRKSKEVQKIMADVMPGPYSIKGHTVTLPIELKVSNNLAKAG